MTACPSESRRGKKGGDAHRPRRIGRKIRSKRGENDGATYALETSEIALERQEQNADRKKTSSNRRGKVEWGGGRGQI